MKERKFIYIATKKIISQNYIGIIEIEFQTDSK